MNKNILALTVLSLILAISAFGKTFKLPNDEFAVASITFPNDWEPEELDNGVFGQSSDTAVYIAAVAVGNEKGMNAELEDTFGMLKRHKVDLDNSTKKEKKFKLNGVDANELIFEGKDEDGPCTVTIAFVPIKAKVIVLTYWVTTEKEEQHAQEVGKIVGSLKAAE